MQSRRTTKSGVLGFLWDVISGFWHALIAALAFAGLVAIVVLALVVLKKVPLFEPATVQTFTSAAESLGLPKPLVESAPQPRPVIYLNREGAILTAGRDDAARNQSSVVSSAGLEQFEVPAFRSTPQRWNAVTECVQEQFAAYDIDVVDRRPVDGDYIMVMMGGRPGELPARTGHEHNRRLRTTGLAPMSTRPLTDAVVFVFTREMGEATRNVCETVSEEVGHAFGLDHVLDASDPMTHLPRRGRRSFQDQDTVCGETEPRLCANGSPTQNSHRYLLEVLGPREPNS